MERKQPIYLKIDPKLAARLKAVTAESRKRYPPTITAVVERGIELALKEMEKADS